MLNLKIILIILILLTFVISIVLFFIIFKTILKIKKNQSIQNLNDKLKKERIKKIGIVLTRVKTISKSNPIYANLFKVLDQIYDQIYERVEDASSQIANLSTPKKKVKYTKFKNIYIQIKKFINQIDLLENDFIEKSSKIMQEDEFMRMELSFYATNLRKVIDVYRQKRILLNHISNKIDDISNKIKLFEESFNIFLDRADAKNASNELMKYLKYVIKLSSIINEGPTIQSYLYITIPQFMQDLINKYKIQKLEIVSSIEHINFKQSVEDISRKFNIAKNQYLSLKLDRAKDSIKNILKSIKILERLINYEIKSKNTFVANYEITLKETKKIFYKYVSIEKEIKELTSKGVQLPFNLSDNLITLQEKSQVLNDQTIKFRKIIKANNIAYSSKVAKMKIIIQKNLEIVDIINIINSIIWKINIKKSIANNKFKQSEAATNEIIANTRKLNLIFNQKEEEEFKELSNMLSNIAKKIVKNIISESTYKQIDTLVVKTTNFYKILGGKIQIAQMAKNMIGELAPQRALNKKLHYQLNIVEKSFLEGNYDGALNLIINYLEERK